MKRRWLLAALLLQATWGVAAAADPPVLPGWHSEVLQGHVKVRLDATCEDGDTRHPVRLEVSGLAPRAAYQLYTVHGPLAQQGLGVAPYTSVTNDKGHLVYTALLVHCPRGREIHLRIRRHSPTHQGTTVFDGYFAESEP